MRADASARWTARDPPRARRAVPPSSTSTSSRPNSARSPAASRAMTPSGLVSTRGEPEALGGRRGVLGQGRAQAPAGPRHMGQHVGRRVADIDDQGAGLANQRLERQRSDRRARGAVEPQDRAGFGPRFGQRLLEAGIVEDVGGASPHLQEPEPGNGGADRVVVDEHAARVLGADVVIRTHDERAFRGVARSSKMPRLVLIAIAHVEDIGRARRVVAPLARGWRDLSTEARPAGRGCGRARGRARRACGLGAVANRVAPRSRTKPSRRQPRVPFQSTYTSLGTPAATRLAPPRIPRVRDMQFTTTFVVGRRHEVVEAAQHLAGRRIDAAGDVAGLVLLARAAVDEHPVLPARDARVRARGA